MFHFLLLLVVLAFCVVFRVVFRVVPRVAFSVQPLPLLFSFTVLPPSFSRGLLAFPLPSLSPVFCLAPIYIVARVVVSVLCFVWLRLTAVLFLHTWPVVLVPVLVLSGL